MTRKVDVGLEADFSALVNTSPVYLVVAGDIIVVCRDEVQAAEQTLGLIAANLDVVSFKTTADKWAKALPALDSDDNHITDVR